MLNFSAVKTNKGNRDNKFSVIQGDHIQFLFDDFKHHQQKHHD